MSTTQNKTFRTRFPRGLVRSDRVVEVITAVVHLLRSLLPHSIA